MSNPTDDEELALNLNGKKKRLEDADFRAAFRTCGVPEIVFDRIKKKYVEILPKFEQEIQRSLSSFVSRLNTSGRRTSTWQKASCTISTRCPS